MRLFFNRFYGFIRTYHKIPHFPIEKFVPILKKVCPDFEKCISRDKDFLSGFVGRYLKTLKVSFFKKVCPDFEMCIRRDKDFLSGGVVRYVGLY